MNISDNDQIKPSQTEETMSQSALRSIDRTQKYISRHLAMATALGAGIIWTLALTGRSTTALESTTATPASGTTEATERQIIKPVPKIYSPRFQFRSKGDL